MIEPQPGQRGVIGAQHSLQRLTDTLEALNQGRTQQQARDTQLQAQLASLTTWGKRLGVAAGVLTGLTAWRPGGVAGVAPTPDGLCQGIRDRRYQTGASVGQSAQVDTRGTDSHV